MYCTIHNSEHGRMTMIQSPSSRSAFVASSGFPPFCADEHSWIKRELGGYLRKRKKCSDKLVFLGLIAHNIALFLFSDSSQKKYIAGEVYPKKKKTGLESSNQVWLTTLESPAHDRRRREPFGIPLGKKNSRCGQIGQAMYCLYIHTEVGDSPDLHYTAGSVK